MIWPLLFLLGAEAASAPTTLAGRALVERGAYEFTRELSDGIGARASGTKGAERAVIWAEAAMKRAGLSRVRREPVLARRWVRGPITATLRADPEIAGSVDQPLSAIALGGSVATPPEGIDAPVFGVTSLEEIAALGARAAGAIVFVNRPMVVTRDWTGYSAVANLRRNGPSAAARVGARAFLIRSAGTGYHGLPHTGATHYARDAGKIPAAALSAEDADLLARRLARKSEVRVALVLNSEELPKVPSWNVVGELRGTSKREEIVLIGAHLDSWDVGRGALDDAAGCGIVLDTARLLVGTRLVRTVRVVLFMGEEIDTSGGFAYAATHKDELEQHVAAIEADSGDGRPQHWGVVGGDDNLALVRKWVTPIGALVPIDVRSIQFGGADIGPLQRAGVPVLELGQNHDTYFDWHHTVGDTFDKIDPGNLALATAAFAHLTVTVANAPEKLTRGIVAPP